MSNLQIQLICENINTGERRQPTFSLPIALGREFALLPPEIDGVRVSRMVLPGNDVSRYHAIIQSEENNDETTIFIIDNNSANGIYINGQIQQKQVKCELKNGDILKIGSYNITVQFIISNPVINHTINPNPINNINNNPQTTSTIVFNLETNLPDPNLSIPQITPLASNFPPACFNEEQVEVQSIYATGLPVDEYDFLAIGAGLGSFIWVNLLRISGIKSERIIALGIDDKPYARYQQLCLNSQIPLHERLRSNSDSCPDNIWGWPSYALRESYHDFMQGNIQSAFKYLWQVFGEPKFVETYTPRAINVFKSIDREAKRIGWDKIYRYGRVRSIRKTDDGKYCIAYSLGQGKYGFIIARYVHLATGYPSIKFLADLQQYRLKYQDIKSVVNAYEEHNHIYQTLEKQGGIVLIRGRGIVASRIIQRIYEARKINQNITVLHLMQKPKPEGSKFEKSQRAVKNHYELQPFNWPKACWGGELRVMLENATPQERKELLKIWGGTTTADRTDWQNIIEQGLKEGWYKISFGEVLSVDKDKQNRTLTYIKEEGFGQRELIADFIIDATGLDASIDDSPLLADLVKHYKLPVNDFGRLTVTNNFELLEMRNTRGQIYASGAITFGGPYAAVDSFLGLQYAALMSVDSLYISRAPGMKRLNIFSSTAQWLKWVFNQIPS